MSVEWDVQASDARRQGCGCAAFIAVVMIACVAYVWVMTHRAQVVTTIALVAVFGALYVFRAKLDPTRWKRARASDPRAMPVPLANVHAGQTVHTTGMVRAAEVLHAPLGGQPCAWFRVRVLDADRNLLAELRSSDTFEIGDGGEAKLTVSAVGAEITLRNVHELESSVARRDEAVVAFLVERNLATTAHEVVVTIDWIAPHELVFVRGPVTESSASLGEGAYRGAEKTALVMQSTDAEKVVVAVEPIGGA